MSTDDPNLQPAPAKKKGMSPLVRIIFGICGVIAIVSGIAQMRRGMTEMSGGGDKQFQQLLKETDLASDEASKSLNEAAPLFQDLLNSADKLGLPGVRAQKKEQAEKSSALFGKSGEAYHLASKKLEEAIPLEKNEKAKAYFAVKIKSYGFYAQEPEYNQQIIRLVMDDSIPDTATLMPKITEVTNHREEARKKAAETAEEAKELGKALK